jgi:hypothetical protein
VSAERPWLSILVPAYNRPDYLRKLLRSIPAQTHRPIEVIVADDASPTSLEEASHEIDPWLSQDLTVRYFRQPKNLGATDNVAFALDQACGKYILTFAHDNWFLDERFLAEAVEILETRQDCHLCIANAILERSGRTQLRLPPELEGTDGWVVWPGDQLARRWMTLRRDGIGWTQTTVADARLLRELRVFQEPFVLGGARARALGLYPDNVMSWVYALAAAGSVALRPKPAVLIGEPEDSLSRQESSRRVASKVKFLVMYAVARTELPGPNGAAARAAALERARDKANEFGWDLSILRHYRFSPEVMGLMARGALRRLRHGWREGRA